MWDKPTPFLKLKLQNSVLLALVFQGKMQCNVLKLRTAVQLSAVHRIVLHCSVLNCNTIHCTALHCSPQDCQLCLALLTGVLWYFIIIGRIQISFVSPGQDTAVATLWRQILHTTHYTLHTTQYTIQATHYTQHTTHYTLPTTHHTLHTTHYTLHWFNLHLTVHQTIDTFLYTTVHWRAFSSITLQPNRYRPSYINSRPIIQVP